MFNWNRKFVTYYRKLLSKTWSVMNNSSLSINIDSKDIEASIIQLSYGIVALIGSLSQIINILVLLSPDLKDSSYKFMLANSVNNACYLLLCAIYPFFVCQSVCEIENQALFTLIYLIAIDEYLTSCMAVFNLLIQIFLSIQRIFLVTNNRFFQNISVIKSVSILAFVSLLFYSPIFTIQNIELSQANTTVNHSESRLYSIVKTDFGSTTFGQHVRTIVSSLRIFLATVLLTIVNTINFIVFKRYFNKREKLIKTNLSKTVFFYDLINKINKIIVENVWILQKIYRMKCRPHRHT